MLKKEIKVGGKYSMKVSGKLVTVQVNEIQEYPANYGSRRARTVYLCVNLATGKYCRAESASKFRLPVLEGK